MGFPTGGCALPSVSWLSYTTRTMGDITNPASYQPNSTAASLGKPFVSVVVVNYNGQAFLPKLVHALDTQTFRDFELVFVDNGSRDESVPLVGQMCRDLNLPLKLLRNDSNQGFARGCNQGISLASAEWIATLNNDTQPESCWLEYLVTCAASQANLGMIAAKLLFARETGQINSAGIAVDWAGIAWDWRGGEADCPKESTVQETFGPCAGAALYSRRMLESMGGFDDEFFAYLEDVDLAWRARLAGWRCVFEPRARAYHFHSATLGSPSSRKSFLLGRNKVWLIAKNYPAPWLARMLPLIVAYDLMAIAYGLARTGDLSLLRGRLAGLRGLGPFLAKRRSVQHAWQDTENWSRMMRPLAPPWSVPKRYAHLYRSTA
jgi:GT2 family glycosyltransferase